MHLLLSKAMRRLSALYTHLLKKRIPNIPAEYFVEILYELHLSDHPVTQKELAGILKVDQSRITIVIKNLIEHNLVYTFVNPKDKRAHFVCLTVEALLMLPTIDEILRDLHQLLYKDLDAESIGNFYNVLAKLEENMVGQSFCPDRQ